MEATVSDAGLLDTAHLGDPKRYVKLANIPILDAHDHKAKGRVDERLLRVIAENTNRRAEEGDYPGVLLGHTFDEDGDEDKQPPDVGVAANFRVDDYRGRPCLFCDFYVRRSEYDRAMTFPHRSVERVRSDHDDEWNYIENVSLLRRSPERNLGRLVKHQSELPAGVTREHYSIARAQPAKTLGHSIRAMKERYAGGDRYYHGTSDAVVPDGSYRLEPPASTGKIQEEGRKKNLDRVFFTRDINSAKIYAGRAANRFGGKPKVVRAIPMGEVETLNDSKGTSVHHAPWAFHEPVEEKYAGDRLTGLPDSTTKGLPRIKVEGDQILRERTGRDDAGVVSAPAPAPASPAATGLAACPPCPACGSEDTVLKPGQGCVCKACKKPFDAPEPEKYAASGLQMTPGSAGDRPISEQRAAHTAMPRQTRSQAELAARPVKYASLVGFMKKAKEGSASTGGNAVAMASDVKEKYAASLMQEHEGKNKIGQDRPRTMSRVAAGKMFGLESSKRYRAPEVNTIGLGQSRTERKRKALLAMKRRMERYSGDLQRERYILGTMAAAAGMYAARKPIAKAVGKVAGAMAPEGFHKAAKATKDFGAGIAEGAKQAMPKQPQQAQPAEPSAMNIPHWLGEGQKRSWEAAKQGVKGINRHSDPVQIAGGLAKAGMGAAGAAGAWALKETVGRAARLPGEVGKAAAEGWKSEDPNAEMHWSEHSGYSKPWSEAQKKAGEMYGWADDGSGRMRRDPARAQQAGEIIRSQVDQILAGRMKPEAANPIAAEMADSISNNPGHVGFGYVRRRVPKQPPKAPSADDINSFFGSQAGPAGPGPGPAGPGPSSGHRTYTAPGNSTYTPPGGPRPGPAQPPPASGPQARPVTPGDQGSIPQADPGDAQGPARAKVDPFGFNKQAYDPSKQRAADVLASGELTEDEVARRAEAARARSEGRDGSRERKFVDDTTDLLDNLEREPWVIGLPPEAATFVRANRQALLADAIDRQGPEWKQLEDWGGQRQANPQWRQPPPAQAPQAGSPPPGQPAPGQPAPAGAAAPSQPAPAGPVDKFGIAAGKVGKLTQEQAQAIISDPRRAEAKQRSAEAEENFEKAAAERADAAASGVSQGVGASGARAAAQQKQIGAGHVPLNLTRTLHNKGSGETVRLQFSDRSHSALYDVGREFLGKLGPGGSMPPEMLAAWSGRLGVLAKRFLGPGGTPEQAAAIAVNYAHKAEQHAVSSSPSGASNIPDPRTLIFGGQPDPAPQAGSEPPAAAVQPATQPGRASGPAPAPAKTRPAAAIDHIFSRDDQQSAGESLGDRAASLFGPGGELARPRDASPAGVDLAALENGAAPASPAAPKVDVREEWKNAGVRQAERAGVGDMIRDGLAAGEDPSALAARVARASGTNPATAFGWVKDFRGGAATAQATQATQQPPPDSQPQPVTGDPAALRPESQNDAMSDASGPASAGPLPPQPPPAAPEAPEAPEPSPTSPAKSSIPQPPPATVDRVVTTASGSMTVPMTPQEAALFDSGDPRAQEFFGKQVEDRIRQDPSNAMLALPPPASGSRQPAPASAPSSVVAAFPDADGDMQDVRFPSEKHGHLYAFAELAEQMKDPSLSPEERSHYGRAVDAYMKHFAEDGVETPEQLDRLSRAYRQRVHRERERWEGDGEFRAPETRAIRAADAPLPEEFYDDDSPLHGAEAAFTAATGMKATEAFAASQRNIAAAAPDPSVVQSASAYLSGAGGGGLSFGFSTFDIAEDPAVAERVASRIPGLYPPGKFGQVFDASGNATGVMPENFDDFWRQQSATTDHPPGWIGPQNPRNIKLIPSVMQYKVHHDKSGSSGSIERGAPYSHKFAGVMDVWRATEDILDPDDLTGKRILARKGDLVAVNAHNRLNHARRSGVEYVNVRYLDSKSAADARLDGAMMNIAQGSGTPVDAAKMFRDLGAQGLSPEQVREFCKAQGLSVGESLAGRGLKLSGLPADAFQVLINEAALSDREKAFPLDVAEEIGGSNLPDEAKSRLARIAVEKRPSRRQMEIMVGRASRAKQVAVDDGYGGKDIFGNTLTEDTAPYAAQAEEHVASQFGSQLYSNLSSERQLAKASAETGMDLSRHRADAERQKKINAQYKLAFKEMLGKHQLDPLFDRIGEQLAATADRTARAQILAHATEEFKRMALAYYGNDMLQV